MLLRHLSQPCSPSHCSHWARMIPATPLATCPMLEYSCLPSGSTLHHAHFPWRCAPEAGQRGCIGGLPHPLASGWGGGHQQEAEDWYSFRAPSLLGCRLAAPLFQRLPSAAPLPWPQLLSDPGNHTPFARSGLGMVRCQPDGST